MSLPSIEIVLGFGSLTPREVWQLLRSSHPDILSDGAPCEIDGHSCLLGQVGDAMGGKDHFEVRRGDMTLEYGHARHFGLSLVNVEKAVKDSRDADDWVRPFTRVREFRQARLYESEYEFWQNAEDPLLYRSRGRSHQHLPLKSNGLPPPLERVVIDVSNNPGRRILREGFVEAVGAVVWLGPSFWPAAKAMKEAPCSQDWLRCDELPGGVIRVEAAEAPFTTATGQARETQDSLRSLLYGVAPLGPAEGGSPSGASTTS